MNRKVLKEKLRGHSCDNCFLRTDATRLSSRPRFCMNRITKPEDNVCEDWEEESYLSAEQLMREDRAEHANQIDKAMKKQMIAAAVKTSKNSQNKRKEISKWLRGKI